MRGMVTGIPISIFLLVLTTQRRGPCRTSGRHRSSGVGKEGW